MKKINTVAVVLKSINFKDSDKIYTLFSRDLGKISAIARGVRKISSRRAGNLDTLNLVKVGLSEGRAGMRQIDEAMVVNSFRKLKTTYELSSKCSYIAELVHRTTEEGESAKELFDLLVKFLQIVVRFPENIDLALRFFEVRYLGLMGYGLDTEKCLKCKKTLELNGDSFYLEVDHGGFVCSHCSGYGPSYSSIALKMLRNLDANKLSSVDGEVLRELGNITSALIDGHLGVRIKSRELI